MTKAFIVVLIVLLSVCHCVEETCYSSGVEESQYKTNMKVQVSLSSIEQLLNRGCQAYLQKELTTQLSSTYTDIPSIGVSQISLVNINSMSKISVRQLLNNHTVAITLPRFDIRMNMYKDNTIIQMASHVHLNIKLKLIASQTHKWRIQVFFRQLKLEFKQSTFNTSVSSIIQKNISDSLNQQVGRKMSMYFQQTGDSINTQLADLQQSFFMEKYDLGMQYNYTMQPSIIGDDIIMSLHGELFHQYCKYNKGDKVKSHKNSLFTNEPVFIHVASTKEQQVSVRYLVSDQLLSSMFGAQYEVPTALDQEIKSKVMNIFLKYLAVDINLDMRVVDKLFNGITPFKMNESNKKIFLSSAVDTLIKASDYPYISLTPLGRVHIRSGVSLQFKHSESKVHVASLNAQLLLSFEFKHDADFSDDSNVMSISKLRVELVSITSLVNNEQITDYSDSDKESIRRSINAMLYLSSRAIQKTINLQGLDMHQFLPQISYDQLSSTNQQSMTVKKIPLLSLIKNRHLQQDHNLDLPTLMDLKKIKASFADIVSMFKFYLQ